MNNNFDLAIKEKRIIENLNFNNIDFIFLMQNLTNLLSDNRESRNTNTLEIEADTKKNIDGKFIAEGNVISSIGLATLKADKITLDKNKKTFLVEGNIFFNKGEQFFEADKLFFDSNNDSGYLENVYGILDFENFDSDLNIDKLDDKKLSKNQYEYGNVNEVNVLRPSTLGINKDDLKTSFSIFSEGIKKWRFKSKRIEFTSKTINSEDIIFTNDVFNEPQFKFQAKKFRAFLDNKKMRFKSKNSFVILEDKLRIPVGRRNISSREFDDVFGIGYEYENKDGYYFQQNLPPYKIFNNLDIDFDIFYLFNRALNGKTKSFTGRNTSITSKKISENSIFGDYFAINTNIYGKFNNFDLIFQSETNSLDLKKINRTSRAKIQLNKTWNLTKQKNKKNYQSFLNITDKEILKKSNINDQLFVLEEFPKLEILNADNPSNTKLDFSIYATYREKIVKAFSADTELYTSYGTQVALTNGRAINKKLYQNSILAVDLGQYQGEKQNSTDLTDLFRYGLAGKLQYTYKVLDFGDTGKLTQSYKYIPKTIDQGLNLNFAISGNLFNYSDSSTQESFVFSFGPEIEFGEFKKNNLDYSKLSLNFVKVQGSASSPFKFDNTGKSFNLVLDYEQQIFGPILFGYKSEVKLDGGNDYGKFSNDRYKIALRRRAYSLEGYYEPDDNVFGLNFNINNFRYKGNPKSF